MHEVTNEEVLLLARQLHDEQNVIGLLYLNVVVSLSLAGMTGRFKLLQPTDAARWLLTLPDGAEDSP